LSKVRQKAMITPVSSCLLRPFILAQVTGQFILEMENCPLDRTSYPMFYRGGQTC